MEKIYITINETSERLGIPVNQVRNLVRAKRIPSVRIGKRYYIHGELLERWAVENVGWKAS